MEEETQKVEEKKKHIPLSEDDIDLLIKYGMVYKI